MSACMLQTHMAASMLPKLDVGRFPRNNSRQTPHVCRTFDPVGMLRAMRSAEKRNTTMCKTICAARTRTCDLRSVIANVVLQLVVTYFLLAVLRCGDGNGSGGRGFKAAMLETPSPSIDGKLDAAEQQLRFLEGQGSSLATANHSTDESSAPAWWTLDAVPAAEFCKRKGKAIGRGLKFAAYTDAILVGRKMYLPSSINCSQIPDAKRLHTKFNKGQKSTPEIPVMVVPSIAAFDDFSPRALCHETVLEPSLLLSFINWPQYGHFMFNGVSLLWEVFDEALAAAGKNIRLYAYGDSLDKSRRLKFQETSLIFDLQGFEPVMAMFSNFPVRSLAALLKQSETHPVCFAYVMAGISGNLDHYNFAAPLEKWREFAMAVRSHFHAPETPRLSGEGFKFLPRFAPADALRGSPELRAPIRAINYQALLDRPRLTILDRRSNRKILNVGILRQTALETGFFKSIEVIYLEDLDVASQIRLMTVTDVLFGIDGTGLMNGIFLPEGGIVIHVRPYGCAEFAPDKGVNFDRLWASNPGRVIRYESGDSATTRFPTRIREVPALAFNKSTTYHYRSSFILKQNTIVDLRAFWCILKDAHRLLEGEPVDWEKHRACTRTVFF